VESDGFSITVLFLKMERKSKGEARLLKLKRIIERQFDLAFIQGVVLIQLLMPIDNLITVGIHQQIPEVI
jgi:hypothetical protein